MKSKNATKTLDERILMLKGRKHYEFGVLKDQLHETFESLKPINLIKNTFREISAIPDLKHNLINHLIGMATGYFSRKIIMGSTHNPIKKVVGALLQLVVTTFIGKKMQPQEVNTQRIQ